MTLLRKTKYAKTMTPNWKCKECGFGWAYKTIRCPVCSSEHKIQTN